VSSSGSAAELNVPTRLAREGPREAGRLKVLRAAAAAFMERGYDGTSIDDIADKMKSSKGRIYHYYRSKHAIWLDVRLTELTMLTEALDSVREPGLPADELLRRMITAQVELVSSERPMMYTAVASRFVDVPGENRPDVIAATEHIRSMLIELEGRYHAAIAEGIESKVFRPCDATVAAKVCVSAAQMAVVWLGDDPRSVARTASEIAELFIVGLAN
jgi:AcrR family transcriptional regulator